MSGDLVVLPSLGRKINRDRSSFHVIAKVALRADLKRGIQREAAERCLKQVEALDAAWKANEIAEGSTTNLIALQRHYCSLAGVPLLDELGHTL